MTGPRREKTTKRELHNGKYFVITRDDGGRILEKSKWSPKKVEPEEVSPEGNPGQAVQAVIESSPALQSEPGDAPVVGRNSSPGELSPMTEAELQENLARLFTNDAALGQALDEIRAELKTTREPGATPEWADRAGSQVEAKMPDIIDTVLGVLKGLVNQPSEGDLFNFDPEFREYVKTTLRETLEARKTIVLRAVEDIEKGRLYYREEEK